MNVERISKMEELLQKRESIIKQLNEVLDLIESEEENYKTLVKYYYSEERAMDIEDDDNGLFEKNLIRSVLSEDAIYNIMDENYQAAIRMMDIGLKIIKNV